MHLKNIPFTKVYRQDTPRPWLQVNLIHPRTKKKVKVLGLIDTGAHECTLPARYAAILGHNLKAGLRKKVITGNGCATVYSHKVTIEVGDSEIRNVLVDFAPHLNVVLLGTKSFLSHFVLLVDYPRRVFSLARSR